MIYLWHLITPTYQLFVLWVLSRDRIATLALLLITNFDVWFFLILLEFSSYWRFFTHFGLSKSIEFYEGFQKLTILLGFLPLSLGILIWAKWNFFTITNFRFFTFLLNYSIIMKLLKIVISLLERFLGDFKNNKDLRRSLIGPIIVKLQTNTLLIGVWTFMKSFCSDYRMSISYSLPDFWLNWRTLFGSLSLFFHKQAWRGWRGIWLFLWTNFNFN